MDIPRVSDSVRRITVLRKDASGVVVPVTLYQRSASKKGTRGFRMFERATRRLMEAQAKGAQSYLSRHNKSNEKKKDGWLRDFNLNLIRASRKGTKALKLDRLISF
jgi:hypothetical protein